MINSLIGVLTMLYPFAVYFGTQYLEAWKIAVILIALLGFRLIASYSAHSSGPLLIAGMAYCGFAIWSNELLILLFYPAIANAAMLLLFSSTLLLSSQTQSLIERLARIQPPDLPTEGVIYTQRSTLVNGGIALATALWSYVELWNSYNGLIAYVLMGILLAGKYIVRMKTQKHVK